MEGEKIHNGWEMDLSFPLAGRVLAKPRLTGITMIIDKGAGLKETYDILEMCADYIDYWKFGFASSALYKPDVLRKKIDLIHSFNVMAYPGGTFLEIAHIQGKVKPFLQRACALGFSAVEVSNGTIELSQEERSRNIKMARDYGLQVLTEVGKKDTSEVFQPEDMAAQLKKDLEDGAFKVILEARESGKGVTIFDGEGGIKREQMNELLLSIPGPEQVIWEAPLKNQQIDFIAAFGPNVNLGNILLSDVLSLESLRNGLRNDTFKLSLPEMKKGATAFL